MEDLGSVITAIVTPFDEHLHVDEEAFVSLMHHLAANGSDGFVVCGTTGEAATLSDDEHLGLVELAVRERPEGVSIIGGAGSNDTRHAVHLTERCNEIGVDAVLSVNPYYNRPSARGIKRHFEEVARASAVPVVLYNIPQRTATDMPNDLLAELAQIERIDYVKQANDANLAPVEGMRIYAGNDGGFARVLDMGEPGGILVASHIVGPQMRRMVDEPEHRAEIDASLRDVYDTLFVTASPAPTKAALETLGHRVGGVRLPIVEVDERERELVRSMLVRHELLGQLTA
ncbi:MAG TPA: 4-hydroxy-tetrahydrodipicolinate synthase [Gaiellaceae bacterium]|nr:4-hydroxy-tetrahydrodipicolinate synthase [Gaiellaceae bacterium]